MSERQAAAPDDADDDLTRRAWLLRLGELTALAGVAGLVPDLAGAMTPPVQGAAAEVAAWRLRLQPSILSSRVGGPRCAARPTRRRNRLTPCLDAVRFSPRSFLITNSTWSPVSSESCLGTWTLARCRTRLRGSTCACRATPASAKPPRTLDPLHRALRRRLLRTSQGGGIGNRGFAGPRADRFGTAESSNRRERFGREFPGWRNGADRPRSRISRTPPESPLGRCYLFPPA